MRINTKRASPVTHEGARARHIPVLAQLRRSVLSCLLWESEFYEDGEEIGERIAELTAQCVPGCGGARDRGARADASATRAAPASARAGPPPADQGPTAALVQDHGPGAAACR